MIFQDEGLARAVSSDYLLHVWVVPSERVPEGTVMESASVTDNLADCHVINLQPG